ncbi:grxB [Symbiodinium natans]|uniref:GrxB protein n=1 Tax=Symbiodinium natans TaxID=878477 RepID=A0A812RJE8_9DINO|nr:grxB [Symbiodinium natans]
MKMAIPSPGRRRLLAPLLRGWSSTPGYLGDLCPFCTRARMIFGLKEIPHRLIFMSYDDAETPQGLIGKKLAPILHLPGEKPMAESMEIVQKLDADARWGPPRLLPATGRPDLAEFDAKHWPTIRNLVHTRFMHAPLPDLALRSARDYFVERHPLEDPATNIRVSQDVWNRYDPAQKRALYEHHLSDESRLGHLNEEVLPIFEKLLHSEEAVSAPGLGFDDVVLFCRLRYVTLVKGAQLGAKAEAYLESMSRKTDIPLLTRMAM